MLQYLTWYLLVRCGSRTCAAFRKATVMLCVFQSDLSRSRLSPDLFIDLTTVSPEQAVCPKLLLNNNRKEGKTTPTTEKYFNVREIKDT